MAKEDGFKLNCDYDIIGKRLGFAVMLSLTVLPLF